MVTKKLKQAQFNERKGYFSQAKQTISLNKSNRYAALGSIKCDEE